MGKRYRKDLANPEELPEIWFRGGYCMGWEAALDALRKLIKLCDDHLEQALEPWADDDCSMTTEPPEMFEEQESDAAIIEQRQNGDRT